MRKHRPEPDQYDLIGDRMAAKILTPEQIEKNRENCRLYYATHVAEQSERNRRYREANPKTDLQKQQTREYDIARRASNPEYERTRKVSYYSKHKEEIVEKVSLYYADHKKRLYQIQREWKRVNWVRSLVMAAKCRAKKRKIEFDGLLSIISGDRPTHCTCCGIEFDLSGTNRRRSPSLDRHDNTAGYVGWNVRVICRRCNFLKSNGTTDELRKILSYMES